jgi:hypothetical protein
VPDSRTGDLTTTFGCKLLHNIRPFCSQNVGTRQTPVTTTDDQGIDAMSDEIVSGHLPAETFPKLGAASRSNQSTTLTAALGQFGERSWLGSWLERQRGRTDSSQESADIVPSNPDNVASFQDRLGFTTAEASSLPVREHRIAVFVAHLRFMNQFGRGLCWIALHETVPTLSNHVDFAAAIKRETWSEPCVSNCLGWLAE